jgi:hypothetical protein
MSRPVKSVDIGARVVRGKDWEWGDQDGGGPGTVIAPGARKGWARVQWDSGGANAYQVGWEGQYDLYYQDSVVTLENVLKI